MPQYPVLSLPLPEGVVTLADYAGKVNRGEQYLRMHWAAQEGFPEPVGTLPRPGSRGRGRFAYREADLDAFRRSGTYLHGLGRRTLLLTSADEEDLVTTAELEARAGRPRGSMAPRPGEPGQPGADSGGRYRLGELAAWHSRRDGSEFDILLTRLGDEERVTLSRFARLVGRDNKTVYQYRGWRGFPQPGDDGKYRLGDLAGPCGYWYRRTGKTGPPRRRPSS